MDGHCLKGKKFLLEAFQCNNRCKDQPQKHSQQNFKGQATALTNPLCKTDREMVKGTSQKRKLREGAVLVCDFPTLKLVSHEIQLLLQAGPSDPKVSLRPHAQLTTRCAQLRDPAIFWRVLETQSRPSTLNQVGSTPSPTSLGPERQSG